MSNISFTPDNNETIHFPETSVQQIDLYKQPNTQQNIEENKKTPLTKTNMGKIYKWRTGENTLVISSEPPPRNVKAEIFQFSRSESPVTQTRRTEKPDNNKQLLTPNFVENPLNVYTPSGLKELVKYSQEIGQKIELRGKELDSLINQL